MFKLKPRSDFYFTLMCFFMAPCASLFVILSLGVIFWVIVGKWLVNPNIVYYSLLCVIGAIVSYIGAFHCAHIEDEPILATSQEELREMKRLIAEVRETRERNQCLQTNH